MENTFTKPRSAEEKLALHSLEARGSADMFGEFSHLDGFGVFATVEYNEFSSARKLTAFAEPQSSIWEVRGIILLQGGRQKSRVSVIFSEPTLAFCVL